MIFMKFIINTSLAKDNLGQGRGFCGGCHAEQTSDPVTLKAVWAISAVDRTLL